MTDRARRICDELKVCREEAIFYLEGFDWNLDAAMEACRSKTLQLPSLTVESPPEKEKSSPEVLSPLPSTKTGSQSRSELIVEFYNVAVGSDIQDATSYLERNDWDLQRAVSQFCDERHPKKPNRKPGRWNFQQYLDDETSAAAGTLESMREEQVAKAPPRMVSSQLKIRERTSPVQDREEKLSPVKETPLSSVSSSQPEEQLSQREEECIKSFFNVAIGASRESAIACLSHCKWNEDDAISYFFGGEYTEATPGTIQESTTSPVQTKEEKLSPVKESAEAPPPYSPEEKLAQLKEKCIKSFRDVVIVASREAAEACLNHCEWDQEDAISYFFGDYREANPEIAWSQADAMKGKAMKGKASGGYIPEAKSQTRKEKLSPLSMSSSQLPYSPEEELSQLKEKIIKTFRDVVVVASRKVAKDCLSHCKWDEEEAISYFFGDYTKANPEIAWSQADGKAVDRDSSTKSLKEASGGYIPEAKSHVKIQESSSPTQAKEDSRTDDELIDILVEAADGIVTRDVATVYLTLSNWNVEKALSCLLEETSQIQASHGPPKKNYLEEDEARSSSSSSNADSTETGNATVASSEVDENVKDKDDVEEDLSTELCPVPIIPTTIELVVRMDLGESVIPVLLPFRSDQTVRDIHNRIDWIRPEEKGDYYFKSDSGVEYRDLDTTVHSITSGPRGSTKLHQIYST